VTRALILVAEGFSDSQFEYAYHRLREEGIKITIASPDGKRFEGQRNLTRHDTLATDAFDPDRTDEIVIVPGGKAPERLRLDEPSMERLRAAIGNTEVVGVVGHGIQVLPAVDALDERLVTAPLALRVDVENAGATWTDEHVSVDENLVTARGSDALPFFMSAILHNLSIPQDAASNAVERAHWNVTGDRLSTGE